MQIAFDDDGDDDGDEDDDYAVCVCFRIFVQMRLYKNVLPSCQSALQTIAQQMWGIPNKQQRNIVKKS